MIKLNPFALSGLLIVITYLPLFILIIFNAKTRIGKIYSLHILSVALWGISSFLIGTTLDKSLAHLIWRASYFSIIFLAVFFYHSVCILSNKRNKIFIFIIYIISIFLAAIGAKGLFFSELRYIFNSFYYPKSNEFYNIFATVWCLIVFSAFLNLIMYYKKSFTADKKEFFFLLISSIGFLGGGQNFLLNYGVNLYPYGNFAIIIPSFFITHAILKHHVLNISFVIKRSISYSLLIATISTFYLLIVFLSEKLLQGLIGYRSLLISTMAAFLFGLIFIPFRNRIQQIIDKFFFRKSHDEIIRENELLHQEVAQTERLKSVATLASGMAHEIRNPLTAIKTFAEYLPDKLDDRVFLEKFSRIVGGEVDRIDQIVTQLLEFAKPSPLYLKRVDIHDLITNTLDFLNSRFIKQHITLTVDLCASNVTHDNSIFIKVDINQLRQALLNIFINAIEAMELGGTLVIQTSLNKGRFIIDIKDSGCGVNAEDIKHIFDPFYTKKDRGTGLGLSITQRIILDHQGRIWARNLPQKGLHLRIALPMDAHSDDQ